MKLSSKKSNFDKYYKDFIPLIKKEKSQKYLYIILSASASIFFLIFAIMPTITTITELIKQREDARFVHSKLSEKVRSLSNLSSEYQEIEEDIPLILDAVPQNPEAPTLVGQIRTIAIGSEVEITKIEILPVILSSGNASKSSMFVFDISGTTSFENSKTFLDNLTSMQRALAIKSIQITSSKKVNEAVDFVFKGEAYFKK